MQNDAFEVEIDFGDGTGKLGITVVEFGSTLYVANVQQDGLIHEWNKKHGERVRVGCRIVEVNSVSGDQHQLLSQLQAVERGVARFIFKADVDVILQRSVEAEKLGMAVKGVGRMMIVIGIGEDGLVPMWNKENPTAQLETGDLISAVNGIDGSARSMMVELKTKKVLLLHTEKPLPEEHFILTSDEDREPVNTDALLDAAEPTDPKEPEPEAPGVYAEAVPDAAEQTEPKKPAPQERPSHPIGVWQTPWCRCLNEVDHGDLTFNVRDAPAG
mmetsp:Transcript_82990/g.231576  ORF Transcript_82990/g.231576 Transcript_82990/m.231576 type:complete len:272 (-) Transcript_82990:178-993(-)|eukprot:CAMPEP_0117523342 /NCGR_PEP_ID=MMETSP0784-20121206/34680_1 /TAXON_ID=39447 /ORGANISM="" /LENGTH=271 /DNA_ID=CAMNT_0005319455 /DNA_START=148 /DNA_END=963 /DNA_ORIENTATION=-